MSKEFQFNHIINPFIDDKDGKIPRHVEISLESIFKARKSDSCKLSIICFEDEISYFSKYGKVGILTRSSEEFNFTGKEKKLPLLREILEKGNQLNNSDYIIYTNADIGIQPYFYERISYELNKGFDALIINRRRVNSNASYTEAVSDNGMLHNGYDCFVFKTELLTEIKLNNIIVGIPHVGNTLMLNILRHSKKPLLLTNGHLTFHLGYELVKKWGGKEISKHNQEIFKKTAKELTKNIAIRNFPGSGYPFFKRHFKWLMNPTIHYPSIFKHDMSNLGTKRIKPKKMGIKGIKYRYYEWLQKKVKLNE